MGWDGDVNVTSLLLAIDSSSSSGTASAAVMATVRLDRQWSMSSQRVTIVPLQNVMMSAAGGAVLLLILVCGLYRLGFFVRTRPDFGIIEEEKRLMRLAKEEAEERRCTEQMVKDALVHGIDLDEPMQPEPYYDHC
jgi:hypothetical protein